MPRSQSAYRQFHSTETAVTKMYNNMLLAADSGQVTALCLLYLTAAFDTVDHDLLILRLERQFGIHGVALEWLRSYLQGRSFHVSYGGGSTSAMVHTVCSVPQGSVLGPRLFILYKADLAEVVKKYYVSIHAFADDTQLYRHCFRDEMATIVVRLERCLEEVSHWMFANRLKLIACRSTLPSLLIIASTNMFPAYVHHVSSGFANFDEFDDHWTMSP